MFYPIYVFDLEESLAGLHTSFIQLVVLPDDEPVKAETCSCKFVVIVILLEQ
jgi:hypothetical protein